MERFDNNPLSNAEKIKQYLKTHLRITLAHEFKDPKGLDDYVKRNEREKIKNSYYDHELQQLDKRLLKPIDKAFTRRSWELYVDLLGRIKHDKLFDHYKDRLFYIARKIVFKDFLADNKEGTYR